VVGEEDSTVPSEAIAAVICGSLESAGSGDIITSLSGGAFSHSSCDAMTSWMAGATVCESWLKVPGRMLVVLSSVIATMLGVCFECTD
jgi:hypothetical protein